MVININKSISLLLIAVLTAGIASAMFYSFHIGRSMIERYAPLIHAAAEIKVEAATAHLWFEELISGDPYIEINQVWQHLDQAEWYTRAMLEGGDNPAGAQYIALEDPALRASTEQTLASIKAFRKIAQERWRLRTQSGIGTDIDQRFDRVFDNLFAHADTVVASLQQTMQRQLQHFNLIQGLLIAIITVLGIFIGIVLRQYERRRSSDMLALQDREEGLHTMLDSIGAGVIATDTQGHITRMNPVAEQLTGWSFKEAKGEPLRIIFPLMNTTTRQPIENPIEQVISTGETIYHSNNTTLIAKDGTEYLIANSAAAIRDDEHIFGMVLVFNELGEQSRLREAVSKGKRDLQAIMDHSPAVIYVKDTTGRFTFINQKFEQLFHIQRADIIDKTLHDIFPQDIANEMERNDKAVLKTGRALKSEETAPQDDGLHTYMTIKFPLLDEEGNIYAVCGISTDITERQQTEEALRRSQKMDAIGQLSGGIAHDFNNQLGVIIGYLDFLQDYTANDEKPSQWVATASRATLRCMDLTRQLLAFSRRQGKDKIVVNLNTILKDLNTMIIRSVTPEVEVQTFLANDLWLTEINSGEFQDTILNLIINARDAMPNGGRLVLETSNKHLDADYASLNPGIEPGDYVQVMLSDTGTGMDKDTLEHIFEPFFTTKPAGQGTGLGMAMVYGFVQRYDGYIKIYSKLGVGSTIRLYMPRSAAPASNPDSRTDNHNETSPPRGQESILIVDDEIDLLQLASQHLQDLGYTTHQAENAAAALDILAQDIKIDLLFSDVVMPGEMNGYELAQQATQLKPDLKVLLTSGFAARNIADKKLARFSANLLDKPYRKIELAQHIRLVFDKTMMK